MIVLGINYKCVIVDCNAPKSLFNYLDINDISYIKSCRIDNTIDAVSTHPDMQICWIGKNDYICEPSTYEYYKKELCEFNVNLIKGKKYIKSTYPDDVAYNVVITEDLLFHNLKCTDSFILDRFENTSVSIYNVKQGYTKCATCIISDNAFITSDLGIYKKLHSYNVDCLLVEKDIIKLGNRVDGFIGGCCGKISRNKLLFCGDISSHKSYNKIVEFALQYGVEIIASSNEQLTDVGSIIPVIE